MKKNAIILTGGKLATSDGKTAHGLIRGSSRFNIVGDVRYERLEMHQGASIDGELRPLNGDEKPALRLAASKQA